MNKAIFTLVCIACFVAFANSQCPVIITRAQWGARAARSFTRLSRPVANAIVHHTAGAACSNQAKCKQQMKEIQNLHMNKNRWVDIGYNFCVGGDGLVYEGRGWMRVGAHTPNFNSVSIGICFIGTFTKTLPTAAALNAAKALIRCGVNNRHIKSGYRLGGHRQFGVS
jgi:N-acetylmuramoyl-L-alanine amidase